LCSSVGRAIPALPTDPPSDFTLVMTLASNECMLVALELFSVVIGFEFLGNEID
jgi:hypothetical protein